MKRNKKLCYYKEFEVFSIVQKYTGQAIDSACHEADAMTLWTGLPYLISPGVGYGHLLMRIIFEKPHQILHSETTGDAYRNLLNAMASSYVEYDIHTMLVSGVNLKVQQFRSTTPPGSYL